MVLVVDENKLVAGLCIGEADAARPRTVGDAPYGAGACASSSSDKVNK
jgi:hypothetical protein